MKVAALTRTPFPPWMPLLLASLATATMPAAAQSSFSDDSHWDPRFNPPSVFLNVTSVASTDDYLIITGERYARFGPLPVYGTVYRESGGAELHDLNIPGWEDANVIAGDNTIYARRGPAENNLAILNLSTSVAEVIPSPPGSFPPLTTFGDDLYALPEGSPYRFNGQGWDSLGPSLGLNADHWVVGSSGIFAAVGPGIVCGDPNRPDCITDLWRLEDGEWAQIGAAKGTGNPPVSALAIDGEGNLIAAGHFVEVDGVAASRVAIWDGSEWSQLGDGIGSEVGFITDLVVSGTTIFSSGEMVVEWDGSSWNPLSAQPMGFVNGLEVGDGGLYAWGQFTSIGDTSAYRVAEWDPTVGRWLPVFPVMGQGIDGYVTALAPGVDGSIFAGGSFNAAGDVVAKNIARWDSVRWTSVGDGVPDDVQSIAAGATRLYAGTELGVAATDLDNPAWSYLPGLPDGSRLLNVRNAVLLSDTLYVTARREGGSAPSGVYRWSGSEWAHIGEFTSQLGPVYVSDLAVDESNVLYATGAFTEVDGMPAPGVARWAGGAWHSPGDEVEWGGETIAIGGGRVYMGAPFADAVYEWDPGARTWSAIPVPALRDDGCFTELNTLAWGPGGLWAGFMIFCLAKRQAAYAELPTLLRWSGEAWEVPGSGVRGGGVNAVVSFGDDLYVGGYFFQSVGGRPGSSFARWNENIVLEVDEGELPVRPLLDQNYPNPFNSLTAVRFVLERPAAQARLEIFDQLGRRVATLLDSPLGPGPHEVSFDAAGLAAGIYLYRLSVDGRAAAKRMVVVR